MGSNGQEDIGIEHELQSIEGLARVPLRLTKHEYSNDGFTYSDGTKTGTCYPLMQPEIEPTRSRHAHAAHRPSHGGRARCRYSTALATDD